MKVIRYNLVIRCFLFTFAIAIVCSSENWNAYTKKSQQIESRLSTEKQVPAKNKDKKSFSSLFNQQPASCEYALVTFDDAIEKVRELKDTYLIVVARLGDGEKSNRLNWYRLKGIENYLQRFSDVQHITAEGRRIKGLGRIEIYVGGKLLHVLLIKKNAKSFCPVPLG